MHWSNGLHWKSGYKKIVTGTNCRQQSEQHMGRQPRLTDHT